MAGIFFFQKQQLAS
uniref:Uncharacterized protein n=1 Tax=Arundo donax TaxID=35708 RepID=A0A0A9DVH7_ARUDO